MSYPVRCPHCGALLSAEPSWAGMQSVCPNCRQTLTIPPPPVSEVVSEDSSNVSHDTNVGEDYSRQAIAAFVVSLCCCGVIGLIMAINASGKMHASRNMNGYGWVRATYVVFICNILVGLIHFVGFALFLND